MLNLLRKRRSVRKFQSKAVEGEKVDLLVEALLRSPSSRGLDPWAFVVVTDKDTLDGLSKAKAHGAAFLARAPLAIVVCADPETSDVWVEDCSIASILCQLAAESVGLGSCWVQIRERMHDGEKSSRDYLQGLLDLPENHRVLSIIGIGYPAEQKAGHPAGSLKFDRIHYDAYGMSRGEKGDV